MLARKKRPQIAENKPPAELEAARPIRPPRQTEPERGAPGSIEQQLDMNETGDLRGDDILQSHGLTRTSEPDEDREISEEEKEEEGEVPGTDELLGRLEFDLSETGREGDEMSGDDHSSGLQGGETELKNQEHINSGLPGEENEKSAIQESRRRLTPEEG